MTMDMGIRVKATAAEGIKISTADGRELKCVTAIDLIIKKDDVIRANMQVFVSELDLECVGEITTVRILETGKRYRVIPLEDATN